MEALQFSSALSDTRIIYVSETDSKGLSSLSSLFLSWKAEFFSAAGNMGCYASKNADSKASRVARWQSTGIVALRDSKLKVIFNSSLLFLTSAVYCLFCWSAIFLIDILFE